MIDTIIFDVGRVLVNWDYESYLKRFAFGPEKTKAITAATFESPYWRQFDRGILTPEEIVKDSAPSPRNTPKKSKRFSPTARKPSPRCRMQKAGYAP